MVDGFKVHIDKLGVDNYINWSRKIKFLLTSKDLWEGVEEPVAHATQSTKALSIIGLNVEDHHLGSIEACKTAKEAWDLLETTYNSKSKYSVSLIKQCCHCGNLSTSCYGLRIWLDNIGTLIACRGVLA
jgi:hypothetical protein